MDQHTDSINLFLTGKEQSKKLYLAVLNDGSTFKFSLCASKC